MRTEIPLKDILSSWNEVCIVGSAGAILGTGVGYEIDKYKNVVRFNFAETVGYTDDVGCIKTMWVGRMIPKLDNCFARLIHFETEYVVIDNRFNAEENIKDYEEIHDRVVQQIDFPTDEYKRVSEVLEYPEGLRAETGLGFIQMCIEAGIKDIAIAGFTTVANYNPNDWFEYYKQYPDSARNVDMMEDKLKTGHDWKFSREVLDRLVKDNNITELHA